jgi:tetratricopeptide (TPR) repeat protein
VTPTVADQTLQEALALHRQGKLSLAMDRYTKVLQDDPRHPDALYYVAVVAVQEGQFDDGIRLAERALSFGSRPARVHNLIGQTCVRLDQPTRALGCFGRAIACDPEFAEAHSNRANLLGDLGRRKEALADFDRALALRPNSAPDWCNRGAILDELGRGNEALSSYDRAISLEPELAGAHFNRACVLRDQGRLEEALAGYDRAIAANPRVPDAYAQSGPVLRELGRIDEAVARLDRAVELDPTHVAALTNRAYCLREIGRLAAAEADYSRAIELDPKAANAHVGRGLVRLARGDWERGFRDYEYRASLSEPAYAPLPYPRWTGETTPGLRLVLVAEQDIGHMIQFSRFGPVLSARGVDVTLLIPPPMQGLFASLAGVTIATSHQDITAYDSRSVRWLPLMSLLGVLGLTPATVPASVPYLAADPERFAQWAARLGTDGFRIGINWDSGPSPQWYRRKRNIPLAEFAPLAAIPRVRLISLQQGPAADEIGRVAFAEQVETLGDFDRDGAFIDTAAVMQHLDLVVTCDASIAHLAGALGRPVFTALPVGADWRCLTDRDDSPWYPTMRLFRQDKQNEWGGVLARIAEATVAMASTGGPLPSAQH